VRGDRAARGPSVAVIGAGIAGLAAAHRLEELGADWTLFEGSERLGGVISSSRRDGFLLEHGPDSFLTEKPAALELCRQLGLGDEVLGTSPEHRRSFVARGGRLVPVPDGFYLVAPVRPAAFLASPLFSWSGKLRMMAEPFVPARRAPGDESVADFVRRRFGREALDRAGQPMLAGIYSGDAEELSIAATMPRFVAWEKEYGSVLRGLRRRAAAARSAGGPRYSLFATLRNGMGTLVDALVSRLDAARLLAGTRVTSVIRNPAGGWTVTLSSGGSLPFDALILAVPAYAAAALVAGGLPGLAGLLGELRYESVATVNFGFRARDVAHPLDGFGFVVPRTENTPLVGCSFSSRKFAGRAPEGAVLLRAFLGGAFGRGVLDRDDQELVGTARTVLERYLGIKGKPLFEALSRYPRAMVQYRIGHGDLCRRIRAAADAAGGLRLCGGAYGGVGIPDCIADARAAAENIHSTLSYKEIDR